LPEGIAAVAGTSGPVLGVDIGGTSVKVSLVGADGSVLAHARLATDRALAPDRLVASVAEAARREFGARLGDARGAGIGVAAQVDTERGWVHFAPNLGWRDVALGALAEAALGLPSIVVNDARAATAGEWRHGAGRGCAELVCFFVGTGIGGGLVTGGRLVTGCGNIAGELGHVKIAVDGRRCSCGDSGCLEAYAGGWAIAMRAREAMAASPRAGAALLRAAGEAQAIDARHVAAAFREADPLAVRLVRETADRLAAGVASLVNALNPVRAVLGGGVVEGMPGLVELVSERVARRALAAAQRGLEIVPAELGPLAGAIGAATLSRERLSTAGRQER
jgi:glucokinase